MSRYRGLVVADDLTGAADTGHEFAARGHRTVVRLGENSVPSPSVLVVNTDSRECSPAEARRRVEDTLENVCADVVYKKVDSTLRGNVASEVSAALTTTGAALAVVAPAFPENGRTTVDGVHRVDGRPVVETVENVPSAHLPTLLSNSHPVAEVGVDVVKRGTDAVRAAFADALGAHSEPLLVVCDATQSAHLAAIAAAAAALEDETVYVGSAGLARHMEVPRHDSTLEPTVDGDDRRPNEDRRVLGVVGSTNPRTLDQLDALADESVVALDTTVALDGGDRVASGSVSACNARFRDASRVVLTAARSQDDVAETLRYGHDHGLSDAEIRDRIARALATTARTLCEQRDLAGFVLTGGAVATAVLSALGADGLSLLGRSVGSGVPLTRVVGGCADGALVVTKAGGFGEREILQSAIGSLSDGEY